LIADDGITTQLILQHALEEQGHDVYTAEDVQISFRIRERNGIYYRNSCPSMLKFYSILVPDFLLHIKFGF